MQRLRLFLQPFVSGSSSERGLVIAMQRVNVPY